MTYNVLGGTLNPAQPNPSYIPTLPLTPANNDFVRWLLCHETDPLLTVWTRALTDFHKFWQVVLVIFQLLNHYQFATTSQFTQCTSPILCSGERDITVVPVIISFNLPHVVETASRSTVHRTTSEPRHGSRVREVHWWIHASCCEEVSNSWFVVVIYQTAHCR